MMRQPRLTTDDSDEEGFIDKDVIEKCYPQRDYHDLYVGEIVKVLVAE